MLQSEALAELFQEAMTVLQNLQDEFSVVGGRDNFHRRQPALERVTCERNISASTAKGHRPCILSRCHRRVIQTASPFA